MIEKILTKAEKAVLITAFSVITALVFVNVVSRYALHASLSFSTELVINLAVVMIMIGASLGIKYNVHPGFTVLRDNSTGLLHKVVVILISAAMMVFLAFLFWYGYEQAMSQFASGRVTPALGIPQGLFTMAIPVGAVLAALRTVQQVVLVLQGKDLEEEPDYREE